MKSKNKINEKSTLEEVLKIKGTEEILAKNNFPCLSCPMMKIEMGNLKLGEICETYGINLKKVLKELEGLN